MKTVSLVALLVGGMISTAPAAVYSLGNVNGSGTGLNLAVPDSTYPAGITSTINVSGELAHLDSVTITLNISGGWNGDLYGYLSHDGQSVTLLNRVGTGPGNTIENVYGYSTSGFNNITLSSFGTESANIHNVENPVSDDGTATRTSYAPDGGSLNTFNWGTANGNWTLFLADAAGGNVSTLQGWSLNMTSEVPEPVDIALGVFGTLMLACGGIRWYRQTSKAQPAADKA